MFSWFLLLVDLERALGGLSGAPGDSLDGPRMIPWSTKTWQQKCLDRPRDPPRTPDTHPTTPPRWFLGCPKNRPQLDPKMAMYAWYYMEWYPMDDIHGIHVSNGWHPWDTGMPWMSSTGYIYHMEFHVIWNDFSWNHVSFVRSSRLCPFGFILQPVGLQTLSGQSFCKTILNGQWQIDGAPKIK